MTDRSGLFAQAAASLAASGLRYVMGSQPGETPEKSDDSWVGRILGQYRQALGDLAVALPRVLERVGQVVDSTTGHKLLFRARLPYDPKKEASSPRNVADLPSAAAGRKLSEAEQALYGFVSKADLFLAAGGADAKRVLLTQALQKRLAEKIPPRMKSETVLTALTELVQDDRRKDLPRLLEELKHEARADRMRGFLVVRQALRWLLESNGRSHAHAYTLLEALADALGETCARELQRRKSIEALLSGISDGDDWWKDLKRCFAAFGYQLSELISVIDDPTENRRELLVMDHEKDRFFEIRTGAAASKTNLWPGVEIYGTDTGRDYEVGGKLIKLPLRVHDAAQGLATWSVDKRLVQERLNTFRIDSGLDMRAWDTGANRTPVALFFVHYRDTDAGAYYELGLGCFVAPRGDPLSVGIFTLGSILVSEGTAKEIGATIWGYGKDHVPRENWEVAYRPTFLECAITLADATLTLHLPRGGVALSSALPMLSYTCKAARTGVNKKGKEEYLEVGGQWRRSALTRFARGESVRAAGSGVKLSVETKADAAFKHPLVKALYELGLIDKRGNMRTQAQHAAWTEHVSAQLGAPILVPLPEQDYD